MHETLAFEQGTYVTAQVRAHLAPTVGPTVVVSGDELHQYRPHWRARGHLDSQVTQLKRGPMSVRLVPTPDHRRDRQQRPIVKMGRPDGLARPGAPQQG